LAEPGRATALRADAQRNRERILAAACDVFVEQGADAPLEEVIARAGVGFGTLYRRFPDRAALSRAVVIYVLERLHVIATRAYETAAAPLDAYLREALDLRVGAVVPMLLDQVSMDDPEILRLRQRDSALVERMIERAHEDGTLRRDVQFADVALLLIRLSRPLPGAIPPELQQQLAHRHLEIVLAGLRPQGNPGSPLPGPSLDLSGLRALGSEER
jgi:AcrR family transcriptional regulator